MATWIGIACCPLHPCFPPLSTPYHFDYFIIGSSNMLPPPFSPWLPPCSMPPGHLHAGTHNDCEALLQSIILVLPLFLLEAIIFEAAILEPPSLPLSLAALAPSTLRLCVSKNKSFFCFCCWFMRLFDVFSVCLPPPQLPFSLSRSLSVSLLLSLLALWLLLIMSQIIFREINFRLVAI